MTDTEPALAGWPTLTEVSRQRPSPASRSDVERLRAGERQAMADIFDTHLDVIYNYCFRRTGSWSAAEDLASTVFLEAWRSRQRAVEVDGSVLPWLYGVATNVCRNHLRSQRRGGRALSRLQLADTGAAALDDEVVDRVAAAQRVTGLLRRLGRLPQGDQDAFILVGWEQLSYAETAQALGIPIGTVRSRVARVRRLLTSSDLQEGRDV